MSERINLKRRSAGARAIALAIIAAFGLVTSLGGAWVVNSTYASYEAYVNRPPFVTYKSKLGDISVTYPSSMVLEVDKYGANIESATLRRSYNANTITDTELGKHKGLIFIKTNNYKCEYEGCRTIDEAMGQDRETFKKVYFYEDPDNPNELREREEHYEITRVNEVRDISGYKAEYFSVEEKGKGYSADSYSKRVFIMIPAGDLLYTIDGETSVSHYDNPASDTTYLDALVESIKIEGGSQ